MKKLIFRKFLIDAFFAFLLLVFSLSLIVWVIQAVNYLDIVSEDGHGLKTYFIYSQDWYEGNEDENSISASRLPQ